MFEIHSSERDKIELHHQKQQKILPKISSYSITKQWKSPGGDAQNKSSFFNRHQNKREHVRHRGRKKKEDDTMEESKGKSERLENEKNLSIDSSDEEAKEQFQHYMRSAFTKDDVYSTTLDLESLDSSIMSKALKADLRDNQFKMKMDREMFLGKKFKHSKRDEPKMRETICYEKWKSFKEYQEKKGNKRCPCYSNCRIF